ncbi:PREDICTED: HERV-H LTR-associating protein 2 [Ceratotherium simum simum]|uniref:HERV-H LTR-associating protein 2 n=1 Tax=Ceratotherium simum simum TaxID=73337 RepID=A0ABM1D799_CERSS|nr:PREDICTED: HERV-H LTR-associating protein 2 [Ceratotherium simum simum]
MSTPSEQTVIGRLDEDVILPCSFENGSEVVIHWKHKDTHNVYKYYKGSDHLEKQNPRYTNRTSLFHSEIHNGNASLSFRRLSLLDEGIYTCYVGTASGKTTKKVVLKVGVFVTPVMKYEKRNTDSFLTCSVLSSPRPNVTWQMDKAPISESNTEETGSLGPLYINSVVNITGSNSSYECAIENSLLNQTWTGRWTMKDGLHKMQSEHMSLSCELASNFFLPNQDFIVTWSRVESGTSSILAYFLSSSQNMTVNEPRFSWNKELINQSDFSLTLKDLSIADSGEYLCNISSSKYTLLAVQTLHIGELGQISLQIGELRVVDKSGVTSPLMRTSNTDNTEDTYHIHSLRPKRHSLTAYLHQDYKCLEAKDSNST